MSGGVDSSVVAAMLKREGYDVVGVTLQLYDHGAAVNKPGSCCAGQDIHDARRVADSVGIPHYVLDYESRFRNAVMEEFADTYLAGATPIPCVRCNQTVKFADLMRVAKELGCDCMATGHYVQRVEGASGAELHRAADRRSRPKLFPVRHHARAAGVSALSARRHAEAASARAGGGAWTEASRRSRTAKTSASCRAASIKAWSRSSVPARSSRARSCTSMAACWASTTA